MTVALLPPVTAYPGRIDATALTEAARYQRTAAMTRWHRPRSGYLRHSDQARIYELWCGTHVLGDRALETETVPTGEPVCATCDGRAVGAGQEMAGPAGRDLLFEPRHVKPPRHCPGSRTSMFEPLPGGRVGRCLVCGDHQPTRAMGGPYNPRWAITQHDPGAALIRPCPFHRWRTLTARDGRIYCPCGTHLTPEPDQGSSQ